MEESIIFFGALVHGHPRLFCFAIDYYNLTSTPLNKTWVVYDNILLHLSGSKGHHEVAFATGRLPCIFCVEGTLLWVHVHGRVKLQQQVLQLDQSEDQGDANDGH